MDMKKKKNVLIIIIVVVIALVVGIFLIIKIKDIKLKNKISKEFVEFLNEEKESSYLMDGELKQLRYAKNENVNYYDVTDIVEDYISIVQKCIVAKKDDKKLEKFKQLEVIRDFFGEITFHSLKYEEAEYILDNITDKDILDYERGQFENKLIKKLETIFEHRKIGEWFLSGNEDRIIELPYNVYVKYVSNKKINTHNAKNILDFKILNSINNIDITKHNPIEYYVKYEDYDGNIKDERAKCRAVYNDNDELKFSLLMVERGLFYLSDNRPTLTMGQHDYDEAERKHWEAVNDMMGNTPD